MWPGLMIAIVMAQLGIGASLQGVWADSIETAIMPGPVVSGHFKYEEQCTKCHTRFDQKNQNALCRDCHEEIDKDLLSNEGFHGLKRDLAEKQCRSCHSDHLGRDADIVLLDPEAFDHDLSDYLLKDRHKKVPCASCHAVDKKHSEAPKDCLSCHEDDDDHRGELGKDCAECHSEGAWSKTKFNHTETEFDLKGKHKEVTCLSCHVTADYKGAPKTCIGCHSVDDVHKQAYGAKCKTCHGSEKWNKISYDHLIDAEYELVGRHDDLSCKACHRDGVEPKEAPKTCIGCHAGDDIHKNSMGRDCKSCHGNDTWTKSKYDHNKETEFDLKGAHKKLPCVSCHQEELTEKEELATDCFGCHSADDVHQKQLGEACDTCHNDKSFETSIRFDHDLTSFPLIGMHAVTACEACHTTQAFEDEESTCTSCHRKDDDHKRGLGEDCATCHGPNGWKLWTFDHDLQTEYRLEGEHEGLACAACHKGPIGYRSPRNRTCVACHSDDDEHRGRFGRRCGDCHTTTSFETVRMGN